jgi:hypothetical protein
LSYQVQLVKALFVKHSSATDFKVPGWYLSDNTELHLT